MRKARKTTPPSASLTPPLAGEAKGKAGRRIVVEHPVHGRHVAKGVKDKLQAVQRAAKAWGLQWSTIARECTFTEVKEDDAVDGGR